MAFVKVNIQEEINKYKGESPEFRKAWDDSREEYRLIGEMIQLRKSANMTQTQLASITGTKQQMVSRIEQKENTPSLRTFCNLLNAMGYQLQ